MTMRNLARASATGVLAVSALAFTGTPALAADVDLGIELKGTTIAAGADGKPATLNLTNFGTTKPTEVAIRFDATKLDQYKVKLELGECELVKGVADCVLDESAIPAPGETADLEVELVKAGGAGSDAGTLTVTIVVEGDTNKANDTATAKITVANEVAAADLRMLALDVSAVDDKGLPTGKAIPPGDTSRAFGYIANHGDHTASGLKVEVKLPKDVTFTEKEDGCTYTADNRAATCTAEGLELIPWELDSSDEKDESGISVYFDVTVSKAAKGPVSLSGGTWTAAALGAQKPEQRRSRTAAALPEFARALTAAEVAQFDVDASDNTDGFSVLVAGPDGGTGGGGEPGGGPGEEEPGLPVTGPVAASVAVAGVAALGLGAFLFLSARRRRVVLVTPADGR